MQLWRHYGGSVPKRGFTSPLVGPKGGGMAEYVLPPPPVPVVPVEGEAGVFPVRPEWRDRLAAITHVDGSARLQTLERDMAPRLYALLEAYGRRSGIPVLLNTSFNVAGEPIVTRALEGYSTFRRCGIDALVAGPTVVTKRVSSPTMPLKEEVA